MNRRTALRSAGALATVGLAGCLSGVREHFTGELRTPIPIEIYSEAERAYNVTLEARERETGRESYGQGYSVTAGERVAPPHIDGVEQRFRVTRHGIDGGEGARGEDLVEEGVVTPDTHLVLIRIYDDDLELEIIRNESKAEEERDELEEDESGE